MPARHAGDQGSTPCGRTEEHDKPAGEVSKEGTLGPYPRESGFDPRRRLEVFAGHEPDGDGTALIPRDEVVRLHHVLHDEQVNGRPLCSHRRSVGSTPSSSTVAEVVSGRDAGTWPRRKPVRVRPVTPERGLWETGGLIRLLERVRSPPPPRRRAGGAGGSAAPLQGEGRGFDTRPVHADVAQSRKRHGVQTAASVGSSPTVSTK